MKKFIFLLSTFALLLIIAPTVSAALDVLIDEVTIEKTDLFSLDVVISVIVESVSIDVPIAIIDRGSQFSDVFSEVKVEPLSSQFYNYRDLSGMYTEALNLQPTTNDRLQTCGPLKWVAIHTNKKDQTNRHSKIKNPNVGYKSGSLRYTIKT